MFLILGSRDIFQHLKNHNQVMGVQITTSIEHRNQKPTLNWKIICVNLLKYPRNKFITSNLKKIGLALHGGEPKAYKIEE